MGEQISDAIQEMIVGEFAGEIIANEHGEQLAELADSLEGVIRKYGWDRLYAALTLLHGQYQDSWDRKELIEMIAGACTKTEILNLLADAGELLGMYYRMRIAIGR